jgi:two-component system NtrC family sensor kinase
MKQEPRRTTKQRGFPPELAVTGPLTEASFAALLGDLPDPVLVADREGRLVFLNRAAEQLFGKNLRRGDLCPICSQVSSLPGSEGRGRECQKPGGKLDRIPLRLKTRRAGSLTLAASATPIRGDGGEPAGCLMILRDLQADLLAQRGVQLQMATLSSILENFPTPFFLVDPDLKLTHVNTLMEKLTGYSRQEMVGRMRCADVINTIQCDTCDCMLKQVMERKKPISGERRVVRDRQGREIPVVLSASIITDPQGKVIGGFEAIRDITLRVEAEKKIQMLTELTREGILMADEQQQVLFVNTKMAEIVEQPKEQIIGKNLGEVLTPQHQRSAQELIRTLGEGRQWDLQFCGTLDPSINSKGERRVFETCMAASRIGKRVITCIYLRDLSARIKIGRELHKTNTFLQNIIQCSVDGIVVVDPTGVPLIFNEGAERILGYKAEEVVGHREALFKFYPRKLALEAMRRIRSSEYGPPDRLHNMQLTFYNKKGEEVPVNFSAAIIREGNREVASVGIFSDLRDQLKMRRELEESQAQLVQAEKIASLGRLAAGVAHEINNPLAGILIYAELLQRDLAEDASERDNVDAIISQTLRCKQIVTRLLEFSRPSLGQKTIFDVNEAIQRCVDLIGHQAFFHNIEVVLKLDPELPQIFGDPGQLQQVFTNLLINAADAMSGQGRITIASRLGPLQEGVIITFTDTGKGIPPEIKDKIFEPFFTTKAPGKGTGLGLSIVYGVIKHHGGTIDAESPPEGGTTFTIRLPLEFSTPGPTPDFD